MNSRVALVTGCASGIGHSIAGSLLPQVQRLIIVDRSASVVARARELGPQVEGRVCDLEHPGEIEALAEHVRQAYGRCDILINNAGVHPKRERAKQTLDDIDLATWQSVVAINLTAPFLLCRQLMPLMRPQRWGRIVNIASRAGRTLIPNCGAHYAATKAGLIGLTRVVAEEGAPHGITVNTVAPGRIATPLSNIVTADILEKSIGNIPLGRVGLPQELAAAVLFLASDAASYLTGAVLDVNGGSFMP